MTDASGILRNMKIGTKVTVIQEIRLCDKTIPVGTVGHVARVSPRLKHIVTRHNDDICVVLKFPKVKSFVGTKEEVKAL